MLTDHVDLTQPIEDNVTDSAEVPPSFVQRRQTLIPAEIMEDSPALVVHSQGNKILIVPLLCEQSPSLKGSLWNFTFFNNSLNFVC